MTINEKQALDFIRLLTGDETAAVTFQTFDDNKSRKKVQIAGHMHGVLDGDILKQLKDRQYQGAGVFIMINEGDGMGRKTENVVNVRALFLDTDGAPMEPARDALRPHIIVESSPGRYHLYWLVSDCELSQFGKLQKAIAAKFGGDHSVHDLPRVMRLPGFYHQKGEPVITKLIQADHFPPYSVTEVIESLDLPPEMHTTIQSHKRQSQPNMTGEHLHEAIDPETGEVIDLCHWATRHPDFMIASALRLYAPQVISGPPRDGKQAILCPFDHEHTEKGDVNGTYVVDGGAAKRSKGFVVHCCHAHCADRDRLDFVKEMLVKGWLPVEALTDSRFLADERRPPRVYYPGAEYQKHPGFLQLNPTQKGIFLYLFMHVGCFIEVGGSIPDKPRFVCRHLGIVEQEWEELRGLFLEVGLCHVDGDRLVCDLVCDQYTNAAKAYNDAIRKARAGGSKTQKQAPA